MVENKFSKGTLQPSRMDLDSSRLFRMTKKYFSTLATWKVNLRGWRSDLKWSTPFLIAIKVRSFQNLIYSGNNGLKSSLVSDIIDSFPFEW